MERPTSEPKLTDASVQKSVGEKFSTFEKGSRFYKKNQMI